MTTAIALSGGIDSLVAAFLLKEQGRKIIGIHFLTGYETDGSPCQIQTIADQLDTDVKIIDCREAFKSKVVDYFMQTYQQGKTPNPCLVCNPVVKFGIIFDIAREQFGASCLATGHYAGITRDDKGIYHLFKGIDTQKDQSYFLAFLTQRQLAGACFPLGNMTKSEVREIAVEKGLHPIMKTESQDVCFIRGTAYGDFLMQQQGFRAEPGIIEDVNGKVLGEHKGLHLFTIGQRRGINCPASEPYYVVRIEAEQNRLVVGFQKDLSALECRVEQISWIGQKPATIPMSLHTRIRYRHQAVPSILFPIDPHTAIVRFESPESAVTPGQGAVFYQGDEVLGAGWIKGN